MGFSLMPLRSYRADEKFVFSRDPDANISPSLDVEDRFPMTGAWPIMRIARALREEKAFPRGTPR